MEQTISIEKILKELYHISGFRISVYDTYFQEIAAFPKELGCLCSLIQENPKGRKPPFPRPRGICPRCRMAWQNRKGGSFCRFRPRFRQGKRQPPSFRLRPFPNRHK